MGKSSGEQSPNTQTFEVAHACHEILVHEEIATQNLPSHENEDIHA